MSATDLLAWGLVAHLVADWLLQNAWMAEHKVKLWHPAAFCHGALHYVALALAWNSHFLVAAGLTVAHMLIDTRVPLTYWRRVFSQTTEGPMAVHVAIWSDQVAHIACLAVAARLCAA